MWRDDSGLWCNVCNEGQGEVQTRPPHASITNVCQFIVHEFTFVHAAASRCLGDRCTREITMEAGAVPSGQ